ncbi:Glycoside hydrolase, superfamily [Akanthomyces lecanii RCEF 1005]|uniref:Glycoside hydrolase, superfamily n=1 Tax=Akanthomyces lecanii RCEF 1005 TaxID=1081108 RepID=A0A162KZ08_CORDF|nr:Glycoside hydrolase, superfamily [Akanthomyces lecanii RCEF 1005]
MAFGRTLIAALAAAPLIACFPAPTGGFESSDVISHGKIVVFDSKVESAVYVPEVVVWDEKNEVTTSTQTVLHLPLSMASDYAAGNMISSSEPTVTTTMTSFSTQTVTVPAPTHSASTSYLPSSSANSTELFGVSYAPYRADHGCKTQEDVNDDVEQMAGKYSVIRVYGTDCDQVPMMYKAAKKTGMKLFLGIWEPSAVQDEANKIIAGVNGDWDMVHTVSVGNELVNSGQASPRDIVAAVQSARSILRAAGYQGPVVTVDTFMAVQAHPELCDASDYCAMNAHPFFDSTTTASHAGRWLINTIARVKTALSNSKRIVITETGWPTEGLANGLAVPGLANQKMALDSIQKAFTTTPGDIILFSAFNDLWKVKAASTFNADQFWGINGAVAKCDS